MRTLRPLDSLRRHFAEAPSKRDAWADVFHVLLSIGVCWFLLTLPLGRFPRELGYVICLVGLAGWYGFGFSRSNLRRFRPGWLFAVLLAVLLFKSFTSEHPEASWYAMSHSLRKSFPLFLAGIEFVRSVGHLRLMAVCLAVMCCYQGLDGIYQYITGYDFILGDPIIHGRLTGSFHTYRVGNLMSLGLPVAVGLFWMLPHTWGWLKRFALTALVLSPGLFLLLGSKTRSAYAGLTAATAVLVLQTGLSWRKAAAFLAIIALAVAFAPQRASLENIMSDGRITELWPIAWELFEEHPFLGVGVNAYMPAYKEAGVTLQHHPVDIPHPHNIYLQFLCETGVVGLAAFLAFAGGMMAWSGRRIRHGLRQDNAARSAWWLAACSHAAYVGYMVTAFSGHNFFRVWWLALSLLVLGATVGACLHLADRGADAA
jgi:hypothetical protein